MLTVRSNTPDYSGFKISFASGALSTTFSCAVGGSVIGGRGCYKADFKVPAGDDFQEVIVPINSFSDKWSSATGKATVKCSDDASVCPTAEKLKKSKRLVFGEKAWRVISISKLNPSPHAQHQNRHSNKRRSRRLVRKEYDTCNAEFNQI